MLLFKIYDIRKYCTLEVTQSMRILLIQTTPAHITQTHDVNPHLSSAVCVSYRENNTHSLGFSLFFHRDKPSVTTTIDSIGLPFSHSLIHATHSKVKPLIRIIPWPQKCFRGLILSMNNCIERLGSFLDAL